MAISHSSAPYRNTCGVRGLKWLSRQEFGISDNYVRDDLIERLGFLDLQIEALDDD